MERADPFLKDVGAAELLRHDADARLGPGRGGEGGGGGGGVVVVLVLVFLLGTYTQTSEVGGGGDQRLDEGLVVDAVAAYDDVEAARRSGGYAGEGGVWGVEFPV